MKPDARELVCEKCGCDYPVWFAPNPLWNEVVEDRWHFLCLNCFAMLADERCVVGNRWALFPHNNNGTLPNGVKPPAAFLLISKVIMAGIESVRTLSWRPA